MAVWGTPTAHEDDAERAVRAALELVDAVGTLHPNLQARAGLLTGQAAVTLGATNQGMVAGDLVNTAARLQGVADPGTVLVGEATRRAAESAIVFEPIGDHSLKGKTSPVPAWQALRVVAQRGGHGRTDTLEAPFVGRDEELRQLKEQLHAVGRDRRARLVSITGPGGIGKSRLVWELEKYIDGVSEAIYWHRGRSPSYGEGITFWALGEMVRRRAQLTEDDDEATTRERIAVTLDEYVEDADERERIGPALLSLLGVEEAPAGGRDALFPAWRLFFERIAELGTTVLVFEDLQWADTGLLDFIDHLLDWSKGLPIMVVSLARPELFDRRPDWGANRRNLTALALEPLTDDAMRELLNGLVPGLPEEALAAIIGRAEGVPLYAVETVRGLLADGRIQRNGDLYEPIGDLTNITVPDSLRSLIASRLDALEPADRTLLQDASVLGQVFSADALAAITGATDDLEPRLRALVRRELLEIEADPRSPERGQYRFVQSLIQEVAYGTLARRDRRSRHLAVARHYEGIGDDEMAGALASHYLAAREASDEGAEADAVSAQARLALTGAADRAAALGATTRPSATSSRHLRSPPTPHDRAPLLDRAARSPPPRRDRMPSATQRRRCRPIESSETGRRGRGIRPLRAGYSSKVARCRGRPRCSRQRSRRPRRSAMSRPGGDACASCASPHAVRATRCGRRDGGSLPGDRRTAQPRAVVAEAFINKSAASTSSAGAARAPSSPAPPSSSPRSSASGRSRCACGTTSPRRSSTTSRPKPRGCLLRPSSSRSRSVTARMFFWLAGTLAGALYEEGRDWDAHEVLMREAFESATLRGDRARLLTLGTLYATARGEDLDERPQRIRDVVGETTDPDELFMIVMVPRASARSSWANGRPPTQMVSRQPSSCPRTPRSGSSSPCVRRSGPATSSERARLQARVAALAATGPLTEALRLQAEAARGGTRGATRRRRGRLCAAIARLRELEQMFTAAVVSVDAAVLLPEEPQIRAFAIEARPIARGASRQALPREARRGAGIGPCAGHRSLGVPRRVANRLRLQDHHRDDPAGPLLVLRVGIVDFHEPIPQLRSLLPGRLARPDAGAASADLDRRHRLRLQVQPPVRMPILAGERRDHRPAIAMLERLERHPPRLAAAPPAGGQQQDLEPVDPRADAAAAQPIQPSMHEPPEPQGRGESNRCHRLMITCWCN